VDGLKLTTTALRARVAQIRASGIKYIANLAPEEFKAEAESTADDIGAAGGVDACSDCAGTPEADTNVDGQPLPASVQPEAGPALPSAV
jgi:hypothetical protein